jgi:dTDP-4-dehydrorhamnose 3,5-epimerase
VDITPLRIEGAWSLTPTQHADDRGVFLEWFAGSEFEQVVGHPLDLRQANLSVSAAGVVRGIHFAQVPPSQAKYLTCPSGAVLDVIVDLRLGSPTYGEWDSVLLDDVDRRAVYVSEGLGHGFMSLADGSAVAYLCSAAYLPTREHGVHPLDPQLAIDWPTTDRAGRPLTPTLSDRDAAAPSLAEVEAAGLLATYAEAQAFRSDLQRAARAGLAEPT